jgi:hypothetical protein
VEDPTPEYFSCGGRPPSPALAGAAMTSVAVAAASIEPPTRAEVQDIKKAPLSLIAWESQVTRPTVS